MLFILVFKIKMTSFWDRLFNTTIKVPYTVFLFDLIKKWVNYSTLGNLKGQCRPKHVITPWNMMHCHILNCLIILPHDFGDDFDTHCCNQNTIQNIKQPRQTYLSIVRFWLKLRVNFDSRIDAFQLWPKQEASIGRRCIVSSWLQRLQRNLIGVFWM